MSDCLFLRRFIFWTAGRLGGKPLLSARASPPAESAETCEHQAGQAGAGDGAGDRLHLRIHRKRCTPIQRVPSVRSEGLPAVNGFVARVIIEPRATRMRDTV